MYHKQKLEENIPILAKDNTATQKLEENTPFLAKDNTATATGGGQWPLLSLQLPNATFLCSNGCNTIGLIRPAWPPQTPQSL